MKNDQHLCIEIPRGDGVGAAADADAFDSPKTFVYSGAPAGRFIVEGSHDKTAWAALVGRDRAQTVFVGSRSVARTVEGIVKYLRVRALGTRGATPPGAIDVGVLPAPGENVFETIEAPSDAGLGKPVDLGPDTGIEKTFIVGGRLPAGARYSILGSLDGERFGEITRIAGGGHDRARTVAAICRYLRIERTGRGAGPNVTVGARGLAFASDGDGGGGGHTETDCRAQITLSEESTVSTDLAAEEEVLREYLVPLEGLSGARGFEATLSGFFAAEGAGSGAALFKLRMGGKPGRPDGAPLVEIEQTRLRRTLVRHGAHPQPHDGIADSHQGDRPEQRQGPRRRPRPRHHVPKPLLEPITQPPVRSHPTCTRTTRIPRPRRPP